MYKSLIRPLLFLLPPEKAHHLTIFLLRIVLSLPGMRLLFDKLFCIRNQSLIVEKKGLTFTNPVGLAAGFDKNATFFKLFTHFGFGSIEVGTVTPVAQHGNPKPRMFRLKKDEALINRMGFNNDGVQKIASRLAGSYRPMVIGGNIGKNKITPNERAKEDYLICFRELYPHVDYFAVNVSSPNTPGLRMLQEKEPLLELLSALKTETALQGKKKPILLKIAPDLNDEDIQDITSVIIESEIDGVIATNTTLSRDGLQTNPRLIQKFGAGGLSGKPLTEKSTAVIKKLRRLLGSDYLIIGVGGIHSADDAIEKLDAGADLIQLYTGFIYEGPSLVKKINRKIIERNSKTSREEK